MTNHYVTLLMQERLDITFLLIAAQSCLIGLVPNTVNNISHIRLTLHMFNSLND